MRGFLELNELCKIAGLGAGITEAVFAVTPSETIKYVFTGNYMSDEKLTHAQNQAH